jgi:hypothetical protein
MHVYSYGRRSASADFSPTQARKAWDALRDFIVEEHRDIRNNEPNSPRVRPTLATSIGMVLR